MDVYELWMDIITPFIYPFKNTTSNDNFLPTQELINKMLQHKPKMVRLAHMLHSNDLGLCFETHPNSWYLHLLAFHLHDLQLYTLHQFDRPSPVSLVKSASWEIKERKKLWCQCILSPIVLLGIVCLLGLSGKTKMVSWLHATELLSCTTHGTLGGFAIRTSVVSASNTGIMVVLHCAKGHDLFVIVLLTTLCQHTSMTLMNFSIFLFELCLFSLSTCCSECLYTLGAFLFFLQCIYNKCLAS